MDRDKALALLKAQVSEDNLVKHCLATEAIMRALAQKLGGDPDLWGLAGLLHDLDYDRTKDDIKKHGLITAEILRAEGFSGEVIEIIQAHNAENLGLTRTKPVHYAIAAAETITGLVVATTLVYPDKKLASVKPKSVKKRMKEPRFAAAVRREHITLCEDAGIPLDEFIVLSIEAMKSISNELGL